MNPTLAYKCYKHFIRTEQFQIQTAHGLTVHSKTVLITPMQMSKNVLLHFNFSGRSGMQRKNCEYRKCLVSRMTPLDHCSEHILQLSTIRSLIWVSLQTCL